MRCAALLCCSLFVFPFAVEAQTIDVSGSYTGTFNQVLVPCGKLAPISNSGAMSVTATQVGTNVTGTVTTVGQLGDHEEQSGQCTVTKRGADTHPFTGEVVGTTLIVSIKDSDGSVFTFPANIAGDTLSGSFPGDFPGESFSFSLKRTTSPAPSIVGFTATPSTIDPGGSAVLSWATVNATSVTIDNGIGVQPPSGSVSVAPSKSTTYTLTASGAGGTASATTTVTVSGGGPRVVIGSLPSGMLQVSGLSGARDSFSIANVGTDPANVSLSASGSFFSINATSLTLQAGGSETVTIIATTQPPGTYEGTVTLAGDGLQSGNIAIPVRLLVAAAPTGSVRPQAAAARVDVSAPAGQNPTGSVSFTNSGTAAVVGIAVADVPWLIPQSGTININPGETKSIAFNIDRSKRPDSSALLGAATGAMSLRFLGSNSSGPALSDTTTQTSSVTVTIVDVVKPGVSAGAPPPLQGGELALLIAGHATTAGVAGDLLLANRGRSPIPDLKLFLTGASQIATLPQIASNIGVTLPSVSTSVFSTELGGTMMLRGTLQDLSAAALRMANPTGSSAYVAAVPVFRSDRGVGPGGKIALSGVERTANTRTALVIQELTGNSTTAEIQVYDTAGTPIGSKVTVPLGPFVSNVDSGSTVVEGARSVVITNAGSGSARINAYARVTDTTTNDAWMIVDPLAMFGASDTFIMPILASSGSAEVFLTNVSTAPVSAAVNVTVPSTRRRAVRPASFDPNPSSSQQLEIRPLETQRATITPVNGYVRISGAPGSISASARMTMNSPGRFGSTLPLLPASAALANGQASRFAGVGDSSGRTIAAGTPATFRSTLILVETAGQSATVRVSLWYTFPAGSLVSAQTVSSKEFTIGASQTLQLRDLARTIIGSQRDAFGDLRNVQVDVEVIDGAGRVLPFLVSVDNGSGDLLVRSE